MDIQTIVNRLKNAKAKFAAGLEGNGPDAGMYLDEAEEEISAVIKDLENHHIDDGR